MVVCFMGIAGIVDRHYLHFLFTVLASKLIYIAMKLLLSEPHLMLGR
jgi:hypothetical protein